MMDVEQSNKEFVKCVVVGDTAVGKTRLICARACHQPPPSSLAQLLTKHVPTVWAIDQYRNYKEILEKSWELIDGVQVSLRLWDTFGDHDKDRRFAYGRSDVILICFSIANPISLKNVKMIWYPEVRRFCPNTPVLLVACKNDLRFTFRDEQYQRYCRDRSPFVKPIKESDLILPDQAKKLAQEIGVEYYETSVLTLYGVREVFENACRAALIQRRHQRFWMTDLKRVQKPLLQEPFCPPQPQSPPIVVPPSTFEEDLRALHDRQDYTDLVFLTGPRSSIVFHGHRFYLAAAWPALYPILKLNIPCSNSNCGAGIQQPAVGAGLLTVGFGTKEAAGLEGCAAGAIASCGTGVPVLTRGHYQHSNSGKGGCSTHCCPVLLGRRASDASLRSLDSDCCSPLDTACLIKTDSKGTSGASSKLREHLKRRLSCQAFPVSQQKTGINCQLNHRAFQSVRTQQCDALTPSGAPATTVQTIVTVDPTIVPETFSACLQFLYTNVVGDVQLENCDNLWRAASLLEIPGLTKYLQNIARDDELLNVELINNLKNDLMQRMESIILRDSLFADVWFEVEGGVMCGAHRAMLMARAEVMDAMFRGYFMESSAKKVSFPGVSEADFKRLLHYLYTDQLPTNIPAREVLPLIEVADRLCLPRFMASVELMTATRLENLPFHESAPLVLKVLEPCQLHNADQLADWTLTFTSTHYDEFCRKYAKVLRTLHPENQAYLNKNRWPPVWYLTAYDCYDRSVVDRMREEKPLKPHKRRRQQSGCLCFSS